MEGKLILLMPSTWKLIDAVRGELGRAAYIEELVWSRNRRQAKDLKVERQKRPGMGPKKGVRGCVKH